MGLQLNEVWKKYISLESSDVYAFRVVTKYQSYFKVITTNIDSYSKKYT